MVAHMILLLNNKEVCQLPMMPVGLSNTIISVKL